MKQYNLENYSLPIKKGGVAEDTTEQPHLLDVMMMFCLRRD
ncbi:hypothetical protein ACN08X_05740 [Rothia sp. P6271]